LLKFLHTPPTPTFFGDAGSNEQISRAAMATTGPSAKKHKMRPSAILAFCVSLSADVMPAYLMAVPFVFPSLRHWSQW
jgi:microcystin-dependent protein